MSGETLEDYFRHLNLDDSLRKYLENIKEGKQVDRETEEQHFKNKIGEHHSVRRDSVISLTSTEKASLCHVDLSPLCYL